MRCVAAWYALPGANASHKLRARTAAKRQREQMTEIDDGMPLAAGNRGRQGRDINLLYYSGGKQAKKYTHSLSPSVTLCAYAVSHRADSLPYTLKRTKVVYALMENILKKWRGTCAHMRFRIR